MLLFKVLGKDTINNEPVTIIEYVRSFEKLRKADPDRYSKIKDQTIKSWISDERGVPLKQEIQREDDKYPVTFTTTIEYKNYNFGDISDEIFAVLK